MSELLYSRVDKLTDDVARLNESVQRLVDENRKARETAQMMVAAHIYFQIVTNMRGNKPDEAVSTMDKAIDGIRMVDEMITLKTRMQSMS